MKSVEIPFSSNNRIISWPVNPAINPNAVRKAYQELEEEGYVCDREGERMAASEKQIAELIRKELLQEFDTVVIRLQNMSVGTEELTGRMWKLAGGSKDFD